MQWSLSLLLLWLRGKLPAQLAVYIEHMLIHMHGYVHTISTEGSPPKRNKINVIELYLSHHASMLTVTPVKSISPTDETKNHQCKQCLCPCRGHCLDVIRCSHKYKASTVCPALCLKSLWSMWRLCPGPLNWFCTVQFCCGNFASLHTIVIRQTFPGN